MLDALRERMAWRAALRAVARRRPVVLGPALHDRRVLVVLPSGEEAQRGAWGLVRTLDLDLANVLAVALAGPLAHVPDAFAGAARVLGPEALDWRRLPRREVAAALWGFRPDVALGLAEPFDLAAAYLAGASPAAFRVGYHGPRSEPFYDLLYAPGPDGEDAASGLRRYLAALSPPVLPFRGGAPAGAEHRRGAGRWRGEG